jgi:hypothetical protein
MYFQLSSSPAEKPKLTVLGIQLEMERKKIELRNASTTIGTAGAFSRSASVKDTRNSASASASPGPGAAGQRKGG